MTNTRVSLATSWEWLTRGVRNETFIYVLKRVLQALLTLLLASALSFFIIQLAPGDYIETLRQNPKISPERITELRQQFGLDRSWPEQYVLGYGESLLKETLAQVLSTSARYHRYCGSG